MKYVTLVLVVVLSFFVVGCKKEDRWVSDNEAWALTLKVSPNHEGITPATMARIDSREFFNRRYRVRWELARKGIYLPPPMVGVTP